MTINATRNDAVLRVSPVGRLDSVTSSEFSEFLTQNFSDNVQELVIDLEQVDFISSKGLRVLVSVYKELNGRKLEIINANASVMEIFRLSGLMKVFNLQ